MKTDKKEAIKRITDLVKKGLGLQEVADKFNSEKYPTISGNGLWNKGTVSRLSEVKSERVPKFQLDQADKRIQELESELDKVSNISDRQQETIIIQGKRIRELESGITALQEKSDKVSQAKTKYDSVLEDYELIKVGNRMMLEREHHLSKQADHRQREYDKLKKLYNASLQNCRELEDKLKESESDKVSQTDKVSQKSDKFIEVDGSIWTIVFKNPYWKCCKRIGGVLHWVHIGRVFNNAEAEKKIRQKLDKVSQKSDNLDDTEIYHKEHAAHVCDTLINMIPDKTDLLAIARKIDPGAGHLISIKDLRAKAGMSKKDFDAEVIRLERDGKIFLHKHVHPGQMTDEEKADCVSCENPVEMRKIEPGEINYYMGLVIRQD